ncbi:helix-turn-helix domain-containing protein [Pseudonocardia sp. GCM10023141]|uniref:helix-turn-helix domain-containing protein n=1 Tax=Pseudonocardia sp. GCM10023141 TaxID=3252653 RepID=UPI003615F898
MRQAAQAARVEAPHGFHTRRPDSELLTLDGPATATALSTRLGENTGTVSWHLRHLAQHGFIEEETGRGTKRERWWRAVEDAKVLETANFRDDPDTRGADAHVHLRRRDADVPGARVRRRHRQGDRRRGPTSHRPRSSRTSRRRSPSSSTRPPPRKHSSSPRCAIARRDRTSSTRSRHTCWPTGWSTTPSIRSSASSPR